jgi:hypothetical protein
VVANTRMRTLCVSFFSFLFSAGVGAQPLSLISADANGVPANDSSGRPSISRDGRYVVFESTATNLIPGDTNGSIDVFVKDRQTGGVTRVSVRSDGTEAIGHSYGARLSSDDRYIVFTSSAPLVADDSNQCDGAGLPQGPCSDVYLHDRLTGETSRVSVASDGAQANNHSFTPDVSANGRFVVFASTATNLVPEDPNPGTDIFLRDRATGATSRIVASGGGPFGGVDSSFPAISDDGESVIFVTGSNVSFDGSPRPWPCLEPCQFPWIYSRATGTIARVPIQLPTSSGHLLRASLSTFELAGDGRSVVGIMLRAYFAGSQRTLSVATAFRVDLETGRTQVLFEPPGDYFPFWHFNDAALDPAGQVAAFCTVYKGDIARIIDVFDPTLDTVVLSGQTAGCQAVALSAGGLLMPIATSDQVYLLDRDPDRDGMPSNWELRFGLDPADASDGERDPDGDGLSNRAEYEARTHPRRVVLYFAEGATNSFFTTDIVAYNPGDSDVSVVASYDGDNGMRTQRTVTLAPHQTVSLTPLELPSASFSTTIESDRLVAVTRTMRWSSSPGSANDGDGSAAEAAIDQPRTSWYFAEGATHGPFDLFYLLHNPTGTDAGVAITYLRAAPQLPITRRYTVPAHQRLSIWVDAEPGLEAADVAARIRSDAPIIAERSMYLSTAAGPFTAGTSGAGVGAPAARWYLAEGTTGDFFDLFLLIANPSVLDAELLVSYLLPTGETIERAYRAPGTTRLTIAVDQEDIRLASTSVAITITSLNNVDVIVERTMWWPQGQWYGGHVTAATTDTAVRWALAGGVGNGPGGASDRYVNEDTYLLVANPYRDDALVTFTLSGTDSRQPGAVITCTKAVPINAYSRFTTSLLELCALPSAGFLEVSGTVETNGRGIIVERSTYWSSATQFWTSGSSALLTRLP